MCWAAALPSAGSSTPTPCSTAFTGSISGTPASAPSAAPAALSASATPSHATASSDKVLTQALRRLLANGLVARRAERAAPPRVEYRLTPLGVSLAEGPLRALADWTRAHGEELLEAQESAAVRTAAAG